MAADQAYEQRDLYKEKMHAAYRSRENAIRHLRSVNDLHELRGSGGCSCGARNGCRTADIIYRPWVQSMIQKLDKVEEQREREQLIGDDNEWAWLWDQDSKDRDYRRDAG